MVTALLSQGETEYAIQRFWRNVYLRGAVLRDPSGTVGGGLYAQPDTGLPFTRAFIIGPDQTVVLPVFGYKPQLMIDTIHDLLAEMSPPGDLDGDGDVDLADLAALLAVYGSCGGDPDYDPDADLDGSGCVDLVDLATLLANYGTGSP